MQTTIFNLANPMPRGIFTQLYSIMEYSFPKDERRDFDEQFAQHSNPAFNSAVLTEDEKVLGFLVGQVMKKLKGKADPAKVNELLRKKL